MCYMAPPHTTTPPHPPTGGPVPEQKMDKRLPPTQRSSKPSRHPTTNMDTPTAGVRRRTTTDAHATRNGPTPGERRGGSYKDTSYQVNAEKALDYIRGGGYWQD